VEQFEIPVLIDRILIPLAKVAKVVGIFEIFEAGRVTRKFLVVVSDGPRVLHAAVDHLFFPVASDFKSNSWKNSERGDGHQGYHQKESEQNVAIFPPPKRVGWTTRCWVKSH